ncbi:MAG TPA: hypothetical protein DCL77_07860 [Prolixibacteraceae bacterium]|jgi:hypothetical protein|nr:hypothetical protein [Prolixibacteraceae bacterium]
MKKNEVEDQTKDLKEKVIPGDPLSQGEIVDGILTVEVGPLAAVKESKEAFEHWISHRDF